MSIVLPSSAVTTARRAVSFSHRRPAALLWLLIYATVSVLVPSPATLALTAALAGVLVVRLRLAELRAAELRPAELRPAELRPAELRPAELRPAELSPAALSPAALSPAGFTPAERAELGHRR
jgi:hypothetical protein